MKIDIQNGLSKPLLTPQPQQELASCFEHFLHSSSQERNGDEYYWRHQGQLQQSALTFNPLVNKTQNPLIISDHEEITQPETSMITNKIDATQRLMLVNKPLERYLTQSTTLPMPDIEQLITIIENSIDNPGNHTNPKIPTPIDTQHSLCQKPMTVQVSLPNSLFKNYQLFVSNNLVELTLNTVQLSKQQTNALQKLIKQWLSNKGYSLKRLMINGVQQ